MSRITHFKQQPVNVQYWDYYILCHLNTDATLALQRMEYWDGTKDDSNTHAEVINDAMAKSGSVPNQDTSYWVYKSLDELQWELMGASGERRLPKLIDFLIKDLEYLGRRSNPFEGWDRKKQYCFNAEVVQEHINYLGYIISYFNLPLRHLRPVFCAIEALTHDKVYIDTLNVDMVLERIEQFKENPKTPHFLKSDLEKFDKVFMRPHVRSFRTFAEWKAHFCGMQSAESRDASGKSAECNPQNRGSNSIEDYTENTDIEDNHNMVTNFGASFDSATPTQIEEMIMLLRGKLEQLHATDSAAKGSTSSSTVLEGGNTPPDHNATQSPVIDEKHGVVEPQGIVAPRTQDKPPVGNSTATSSPSEGIAPMGEELPTNEKLRDGLSKGVELTQSVSNEELRDGAKQSISNSYSPPMATKQPVQPIPITSKVRPKKDAKQELTLQGSHIIELYEAFKKRKITRNPANVKAANGLGDVVDTDQDFNEVLTLMANDKFLKEHGVRIDLDFVYRKYDGFLDRVDRLREEAERRSSGKLSQGNTNPPTKQEQTTEQAALIAEAKERLAKHNKQRQAI